MVETAFRKTIDEKNQLNSFRKEIDKYDELAELEDSWNAEFTGKNIKK